MQIIKKPNAADWHHTFTCKKCKAELEADVSDVRHSRSSADGPHPASDNYRVDCPVCHEGCYLDERTVPAIVLIEARQKSRVVSSSQWDDH